MASSRYTRATYRETASLLGESLIVSRHSTGPEAIAYLVRLFGSIYASDNPRFDKVKFMEEVCKKGGVKVPEEQAEPF